jgi:uncharacterized membrane protein YdjX (TVP38/TMEM64 family)
MSPRGILKGLFLIATLAALGFLVEHGHLADMLSRQWIDSAVRDKGWDGDLMFLAMGAATTALGFPRQVVAFLGGYAFGFLDGVLLAMLAMLSGCVLAFVYARWFGGRLVARHFRGRIRKVDDFLGDHPFSMTVVIRFLPVGSNLATNLLAGVSSVRAWPFFAGSAVGYLPQTLAFTLAGSGVHLDPALRLSLASLLFVVSGMVGIRLYRRQRQVGEMETAVDAMLAGRQGAASPR